MSERDQESVAAEAASELLAASASIVKRISGKQVTSLEVMGMATSILSDIFNLHAEAQAENSNKTKEKEQE